MAEMIIDYNRGVTKRIHTSGVEIYMYKDTPGEYLNARGDPVSEELAASAGFPVEELKKAKLKRERMKTAMDTIEAEIGAAETTEVVEAERNGYKMVNIGFGRYHVRDPDNNNLTPTPVPKEVAELLLKNMGGEEEVPKDDPDEGDPPKVPLKGKAAPDK